MRLLWLWTAANTWPPLNPGFWDPAHVCAGEQRNVSVCSALSIFVASYWISVVWSQVSLLQSCLYYQMSALFYSFIIFMFHCRSCVKLLLVKKEHLHSQHRQQNSGESSLWRSKQDLCVLNSKLFDICSWIFLNTAGEGVQVRCSKMNCNNRIFHGTFSFFWADKQLFFSPAVLWKRGNEIAIHFFILYLQPFFNVTALINPLLPNVKRTKQN